MQAVNAVKRYCCYYYCFVHYCCLPFTDQHIHHGRLCPNSAALPTPSGSSKARDNQTVLALLDIGKSTNSSRYALFSLCPFCFTESHVIAASRADPNLVASQTADASYPPSSLKSIPRPFKSHASHRTSQPTKVRDYPDRVNAKNQRSGTASPSPIPELSESEVAPNLPYYVTRTPSHELPIYHLTKRGGNLHQTRVKKISGNIDALRDALKATLDVAEKDCVINRVTNHVMIKGFHRPRIEAFLLARKF